MATPVRLHFSHFSFLTSHFRIWGGRASAMMGQRDAMFRQEASKPQAVRATLGRFWRYFSAYRHVLLVVALLVVVSTYLQVTIPDLIGQAVDCYLTPATQAALARGSGIPGT